MATPKVDVVIACLNGAPFLRKSLLSAATQVGVETTVIVVDDGSDDDSEEVVASVGAPNVQFVRNPGRGVSSARNYGASLGDSPHISFLDVDDWWEPNKLHTQIDGLAREEDAHVAYSSTSYISSETGRTQIAVARHEGWISGALFNSNVITGSTSSVLVGRRHFDDVGGFDEAREYAEDWELWFRLSLKSRFVAIAEPTVNILRRPDSYSANVDRMLRETLRLQERWVSAGYVDAAALAEGKAQSYLMTSYDYNERQETKLERAALIHAIRLSPWRLELWRRLLRCFF